MHTKKKLFSVVLFDPDIGKSYADRNLTETEARKLMKELRKEKQPAFLDVQKRKVKW